MNILHLNGYDVGGGAETVFNITRNNNGNNLNYSGFIESKESPFKSDIKFNSYMDSPKPLRIIAYLFSYKNYKAIKLFLKNKHIDVIHIHNIVGALSPSILLALKKIKRSNNVKIVQTMHDFILCCPNSLLFDYSKNEICEKCLGKNIKIYPLFNSCDRRGRIYSFLKGIRSIISNNIIKHKNIIDRYIAPSYLMKDKLLEDGLEDSKLVVIRNPFPKTLFEDFQKQNIICYFGRFSKEKNILFIVNAFIIWKQKRANDFKLFLIGGGEEEESIVKFVNNSIFKKDIVVSKYLPENELMDFLKPCKYFLMASILYENAPMTILEAIALNIIPIVPSIGGMKETVESITKVGRVYNSENYESVISNLDELEDNYNEEIQKLNYMKQTLIDDLGTKKYYSSLTELYGEMME